MAYDQTVTHSISRHPLATVLFKPVLEPKIYIDFEAGSCDSGLTLTKFEENETVRWKKESREDKNNKLWTRLCFFFLVMKEAFPSYWFSVLLYCVQWIPSINSVSESDCNGGYKDKESNRDGNYQNRQANCKCACLAMAPSCWEGNDRKLLPQP